MQIKYYKKTIGKRYKECLGTMVFLLDFLLEERRDGLVKPIKTNGWRD